MATVDTRLVDKVVKLLAQAVVEFGMIQDGDRVAVALSGGKDSWALLHSLLIFRSHAPIKFDVTAFTVEQGKFLGELTTLAKYLQERAIAWKIFSDAASLELVNNNVTHGCDTCSRYRRRAVYEVAALLDCNVVALGHTADDFAEAILRNLLYTGKVNPLPPIARSSKGDFRIIRPLVYVRESLTEQLAANEHFPLVPCVCSLKSGTRSTVRGVIESLNHDNRHVHSNLIAASVDAWRLTSK